MKQISLTILFLFQTACGFQPVYKTQDSTALSYIEVKPIESVEGTYFYNHLKSILPPLKEAKYILNTNLAFSNSYNIIQLNSDILRETQNVLVNYQLIEKQSLKKIIEGSFIKTNSYSVNFSSYFNNTLKQQSTKLLAENAAEEVRNRLIIFLPNIITIQQSQ